MNKIIFKVLVIVLVFNWLMVVASIISWGFGGGARWVVGFLLLLTVSLILMRRLPDRSQLKGRLNPVPPPTRGEKFVASKVGIVVVMVLGLINAVGSGSAIGLLLCAPVKGVVETIADLPQILGPAIVGAAISMIGFGLFGLLVLVMQTGSLVHVYEDWLVYVAPVIGGVGGAALGGGLIVADIRLVGLSALIGMLATIVLEVSAIELEIDREQKTGPRRRPAKSVRSRVEDAVGSGCIGGVGFGLINGIILIVLFKALGVPH